MNKTTFINNVHNTSIARRVTDRDLLDKRAVARMRNRLCGSATCQCSGESGVRGGDSRVVPWDDGLWQVQVKDADGNW